MLCVCVKMDAVSQASFFRKFSYKWLLAVGREQITFSVDENWFPIWIVRK